MTPLRQALPIRWFLANLLVAAGFCIFAAPSSAGPLTCSAAFSQIENQAAAPQRQRDEIPSLYVDRELVSKGQWTRLNGKRVRVLDYYASAGGDVLVVQTKKGKTKILSAAKIESNLVVIDHVRLSELLAYKNERVVDRFIRDHGVPRAHAERTFQELMKWFFVLHRYTSEGLYDPQHPRHFTLGMYNETHAIDEMWHEFILFTIDYHEFGRELLGYYQHHQPFDREKPKTTEEKRLDRLKMYDYIRETLGPETLREWFVDQKFTDPKMPVGYHVDVPPGMIAP